MESLESNNSNGTEPAALSVIGGAMEPWGVVSGRLKLRVPDVLTLKSLHVSRAVAFADPKLIVLSRRR